MYRWFRSARRLHVAPLFMEKCPTPCNPRPPPPPEKQSCPPQKPFCPPLPEPKITEPCIDATNPCNYQRPKVKDPYTIDGTRLKRLQCLFQKDDGQVVWLKKGLEDKVLVALNCLLLFISLVMTGVAAVDLYNL